ncbi:MAG: 4Fe-4S dicluster domain-containing protein [Candidatus Desulfacyla sp.]
MKPYALIINHDLCWGCRTCEVACKQENGAPDGIRLIAVSQDGPRIVDGKLDVVFRAGVCRHCDDPACVDACPEEAITQREDGIVILDIEQCSGCGSCVEACPYDAIALDGVNDIARKCNLCHHRVDRGLVPACADNVCPAHCIYFGDPDGSPWGLPE